MRSIILFGGIIMVCLWHLWFILLSCSLWLLRTWIRTHVVYGIEHAWLDNLGLEFSLEQTILSHLLNKCHFDSRLVAQWFQEEFWKYFVSLPVVLLLVLFLVLIITRIDNHFFRGFLSFDSSFSILISFCILILLGYLSFEFLAPLFLCILHSLHAWLHCHCRFIHKRNKNGINVFETWEFPLHSLIHFDF